MNPWTMRSAVLALACLLVTGASVVAQEQEEKATEDQPAYEHAAMMEAWQRAGTPGEEHDHLAAMSGTWDIEVTMWMDPTGEPVVETGTSVARIAMEGRYLVEDVTSVFMGQPFEGHGITGFNNVTGDYEAIWIDNHSTAIHSYRGSIDEAGDLVMTGTYTDPATGQEKESRGVLRFVSSDEMMYEAYEFGPQGEEWKVMEITYRKRS